ncbi:MBL fold metallo-hydrolase [uncultured Desulfobulbus sp.]|uniref:MBL fold metallo-hydrolase n=1 Tax=uncultured Desulfobulbus sp. TaxID=239745 RepID=UPI0029C929B6|nr:MBL fold metallo-hydrolase [uncultured Desulfobulbus sp.]
MKIAFVLMVMMTLGVLTATAQEVVKRDVIKTSAGDLELVFIGHSSLMMTFRGKIIHFDPYGKMADYKKLPKADLIFITHDHNDHFDLAALQAIQKKETTVILPPICSEKVPEGWIMENGESLTVQGVEVQALPAFNMVHKRESGQAYHPKGIGNGYVLTFGDKRIYVAGDTENIADMKALKGIDCAFLPMSVPSTMTPEMVADAAKAFKPKILYPYHYNETDPKRLTELLKNTPVIEVRIRQLR